MNKNTIFTLILVAIIALGFVLRLYRFDNPIADWHSWRQSDTSAVSKLFIKNGFDPLHPTYYDISNIQSGKDNPEGYRFVEFPLYNLFQAGFYSIIGIFSLEQWGRLTTIFASVASMLFLFLIGRRYAGVSVGLIASFFFAFLPYSIFYGRTILPDQMMATAILGGIYFFGKWIDNTSKVETQNYLFYFLALLFTASAFLLKPYALFFTLPMIYLAWDRFGFGFLKKWQLWVFLFLSIIPLVAWRIWIMQFPEGIPASDWLLNGGDIRFKGAFFYWLFGERLSRLILGYFGLSFLLLGLFKKSGEKQYGFFLSFLISSLLYMTVIARGNVQHDYYQILIIPTVALLMARGVSFLFSITQSTNKVVALLVTGVSIVLMLALSWYQIRDYFNVNNMAMVEAGKKADVLLPKDAKVIAPYDGDTTFLYYINRKGWPAFQDSAEKLHEMGATHMILLQPKQEDVADLMQKYDVVASSSSYLMLQFK